MTGLPTPQPWLQLKRWQPMSHHKESLPISGSYSLRHIAHTNNGFFKLVEALLQIHSCFFSHSIKLRSLPLSAVTVSLDYLPRCVRSTITCGKRPTTVTWSDLLKICCRVYCYAIKNNSRTIRSQISQPVFADKGAYINLSLHDT